MRIMLSTMLEFLEKVDANIISLHCYLLQSQNANTNNSEDCKMQILYLQDLFIEYYIS